MDRPSAADRIRAATWFAERGFGIFSVWSTEPDGTCRCPKGRACDNAGKHPIAPRGFHDATSDVPRIRRILAAGSDPNYGLVCPPGVFALDVDGPDIARLDSLEERLGPLPPTLRTQTANGWHIFLRWPEGLPEPQGKLFGFVTRFGDTGYVIGPRSVHASGTVYRPDGTAEIAEVPSHWVAAARKSEPATSGPTIHIGGELPDVGGRHDWLRDRARYYRGMGMSREVLEAALLAENARLAEPKNRDAVIRAIGDVFAKFEPDEPAVIEEKISRRLGDDELGLLGPSTMVAFPDAPGDVAYEGLLGEMVGDIAAGTDSSLVGILGSLVALCGALVPGQAYFHRVQTTSPFIALVGESGIGRKGTAMYRAKDAMSDAVEEMYVNRAVLDGLNSGEGLISALAYKQETFKYEPTVGLVFEEEYANLLASRGREGSTLDPKMRVAFDGGVISNRRAADSKSVVPPYWLPALIAITPVELKQRLELGSLQSGSANRWLYLPVTKRDMVPANSRPVFSPSVREEVLAARRWAIDKMRVLEVEPEVTTTLTHYSDWLPTVSHGVAHDLTRRFSVIAFRIALIHAVVERSEEVTLGHVHRALALTEYARRGVSWVFGSTVGNDYADLLLRNLRDRGALRLTQITRYLIRDSIRRQAAIDELIRLGLARIVVEHPASGRPASWLEPAVLSTESTYFHSFPTAPPGEDEGFGKNPPFERETAGKNVERTWKEVELTGRNGTKSESETITCSDYVGHQSQHRHTDRGWICPVCTPPVH